MENIVKISNLKPGMENVRVKVQVLDVKKPRTIKTKKGMRTLSEALVSDDTGQIKLILWGRHAGSLTRGEVIEIRGAFVREYRGIMELNVPSQGKIRKLNKQRSK